MGRLFFSVVVSPNHSNKGFHALRLLAELEVLGRSASYQRWQGSKINRRRPSHWSVRKVVCYRSTSWSPRCDAQQRRDPEDVRIPCQYFIKCIHTTYHLSPIHTCLSSCAQVFRCTAVPRTAVWEKLCQHWTAPLPLHLSNCTALTVHASTGPRVHGAGHLNCANLRPSTAGHTSYNHPSPLSAAADRHQKGLGYWSPAQSQLMQKTMTKSINLQLNPQCLESLATWDSPFDRTIWP